MIKNKEYYQTWHGKWLKIFKSLGDHTGAQHKASKLQEKVRKHLWLIEWRLLCVKWYGERAEDSDLFPKDLKIS